MDYPTPEQMKERIDGLADVLAAPSPAFEHMNGKIDKTQEMLNRMARVQVEATIRAMVNDTILQAKAQALNVGKVKQLAYYRNQLKSEVAYSALMAADGAPPAAAKLH